MIQQWIAGLGIPPGPPNEQGSYYIEGAYPQMPMPDNTNDEPPLGWPRNPVVNEPGDVPGPPVQFGPEITSADLEGGYGFVGVGAEEVNRYYYHPDHLGSTSYITNATGEVAQHVEYIAFGETLFEEHLNSEVSPYLFNGKERDSETGLYYYGARYYDPKISLWLSVDPLAEKTMTPYQYCNQSPVMLVDPTGMEGEDPPGGKASALQMIENFRNDSNTSSVWSKISKNDFLNDLATMIKNPESVNQANTNLCGVALPVKFAAENNPEELVNMALGLYQSGGYFEINSNENLYNNKPTNGLNNAEYVIMTSLRNELNIGSYDPSSDSGISGMTYPSQFNKMMENWFGFERTTSQNTSSGVLGFIKSSIKAGDMTALLVNWDGLVGGTSQKKKQGSVINVPTHYINIVNYTDFGNGNIEIGIWHWGHNYIQKIKTTTKNLNKMTHDYGSWK